MSTTTLDDMMADMPRWGSEFARTYANHAPMILVALDRLGARPQRLEAFFNHYRDYKQLLPFGSATTALNQATWSSALMRRDKEPELRAFFTEEVATLGITGALHLYLPVLSPYVGASALHALMRLAYGLIREDERDVGIALAYWAATAFPMPESEGRPPLTDDPASVLTLASAIDDLHGLPIYDLIWQNMAESGSRPGFAPVIDWLEVTPETQGRMAGAAIALFAATQDFCALHAVTGMHWMRIVLPYCPVPDLLLRHFWQCIAAVLGEMGFPAVPNAGALAAWRNLPVPHWDAIKAAAAASNDEHDISLVFSASEEMKVYGDPLYQLAAARRVGLVGDYTK